MATMIDKECLEASKPKTQIDLRAGVNYLHAVETIKLCAFGIMPTAEAALDAVEMDYECALQIVFPLGDDDE